MYAVERPRLAVRDDLPDGGAGHFRDVIQRCREVLPELDETVRDELVDALPNQTLATAIRKLDTDERDFIGCAGS